jgi:hypothetical protein
MRRLGVFASTPDDSDLGRLEVATPCDVRWDSLAGDDRVRHCGRCRQNVYNIQAMGRDEALRVIAHREGPLCLRIFRRPDGTVVTADCWSRLRAARRKGLWALAAMLVVVAWAEIAAIVVGLHRLSGLGGLCGAGDGADESTMGSAPAPAPSSVASSTPSWTPRAVRIIPAEPSPSEEGWIMMGGIGGRDRDLDLKAPTTHAKARPHHGSSRLMGRVRRR